MLGPLRSRRTPLVVAMAPFVRNQRGAAGLEYALVLVSVGLVGAAAYNMFGRKPAGTTGGPVGSVNETFSGSPTLPGGDAVPVTGASGATTSGGAASPTDASIATKEAFTTKWGGAYKGMGELDVAWKVYKESNSPTQINVIGRRDDTAAAKTWAGHDAVDTQGWTPAVNDAWIQGGIDRGATFFLGSNPAGPGFTNQPGAAHPTTIFKREYDQLLTAGYVRHGYEMWSPARK